MSITIDLSILNFQFISVYLRLFQRCSNRESNSYLRVLGTLDFDRDNSSSDSILFHAKSQNQNIDISVTKF